MKEARTQGLVPILIIGAFWEFGSVRRLDKNSGPFSTCLVAVLDQSSVLFFSSTSRLSRHSSQGNIRHFLALLRKERSKPTVTPYMPLKPLPSRVAEGF